MYYIYIIRNQKTGEYYTGITNNLRRRIREHNQGKKSTKTTYYKRGGWKLVYYEVANNRIAARKREKYLKSGRGRIKREKLIEGLKNNDCARSSVGRAPAF